MMTDVNESDPSSDEATSVSDPDVPEAESGDPGADVDPVVLERRAELVRQAREATQGRPELAELVDRVEALEGVDLAHHGEELDAVHRALREALAAAGREDSGSS